MKDESDEKLFRRAFSWSFFVTVVALPVGVGIQFGLGAGIITVGVIAVIVAILTVLAKGLL